VTQRESSPFAAYQTFLTPLLTRQRQTNYSWESWRQIHIIFWCWKQDTLPSASQFF